MTSDLVVSTITRRLFAADADVRARSADEVTDVLRGLDSGQVHLLARGLAAARIDEMDPVAQEAQLHALSELAEWHELPSDVFARVAEIPEETVTGSQVEYRSYLRERSTLR